LSLGAGSPKVVSAVTRLKYFIPSAGSEYSDIVDVNITALEKS